LGDVESFGGTPEAAMLGSDERVSEVAEIEREIGQKSPQSGNLRPRVP